MAEERKDSVRVVEFKFDIQKPPVFKEQKGKDWIMFGIDDPYKNLYPQFLIDLFNRSAKHNAIVSAKSEFISANGFVVDAKGLSVERHAALEHFINYANEDEGLNDILPKIATDLELFNGFALEVIPKKGGHGYNIFHVPMQKLRTNKDCDTFFFSEDWKKSRPEVEEFDAFDFDKPNHGILYVKMYRPNTEVYPIPNYIGAIPYILTDVEIANFHYNSIKNGFVGGTLINLLNGTPDTEEAKNKIYNDITRKLTGSDNANSIILNFADGKDRAAEVLSLMGNDFDKRFSILNDTVRKEIFSGHKITDPQLFGIFKDGAFSNASELSDSWALFQNTYIEKRQRFIEDVFNGLIASFGLDERLSIQKVEPISVQLSEAVVVGVMTRAEIRERAGLPIEEVGPVAVEQVPPTEALAVAQMTFEELEVKVAKRFSDIGYSLDEWEIVKARPFMYIDHVQLQAEDGAARNFAFAPVPPIQANILDLLNKDPFLTAVRISQLVGLSIEATMGLLQQMGQAGLIEYTTPLIGDVTQRIGTVTNVGKDVLAESRTTLPSFRIAYRYVVRDGAGEPIIPTTRIFCRDMVNQSNSRVWDATQITSISLEENRNVWLRGGGFWRRAGKNGITTPHCRHEWEQVVITERRNG
jgi:hypothetical protein